MIYVVGFDIVFTIGVITLQIFFAFNYILNTQSVEIPRSQNLEIGKHRLIAELAIQHALSLILIILNLVQAFLLYNRLQGYSENESFLKIEKSLVLDIDEYEGMLEKSIKDENFASDVSIEEKGSKKYYLQFYSIFRKSYFISIAAIIVLDNGIVGLPYAIVLITYFWKNIIEIRPSTEFKTMRIASMIEKPYSVLLLIIHLTLRTNFLKNKMTVETHRMIFGGSFNFDSIYGYYLFSAIFATFIISCSLSSSMNSLEEFEEEINDQFFDIEFSKLSKIEKFLARATDYLNVGAFRAFQITLVVWGLMQPTIIMSILFIGGGIGLILKEKRTKLYLVTFQMVAGLYIFGQIIINLDIMPEEISNNSNIYLIGFYQYHKVFLNNFFEGYSKEASLVASNRFLYMGEDIVLLTFLNTLFLIIQTKRGIYSPPPIAQSEAVEDNIVEEEDNQLLKEESKQESEKEESKQESEKEESKQESEKEESKQESIDSRVPQVSSEHSSLDINELDFSIIKNQPSSIPFKEILKLFMNKWAHAFIVHTAKVTLVLLFLASLTKFDGFHAGYFVLFVAFSLISLVQMERMWKLLLGYTLISFASLYVFQLITKFEDFKESYLLSQIGLVRVHGIFLKETKEHLGLLLILFLQSTIFKTQRYRNYLDGVYNKSIEDIDLVSVSSDSGDIGQTKGKLDIFTKFYIRHGMTLCYIVLLFESFLYPLNVTSFCFFLFFALLIILYLVHNDERKSFMTLKSLWPGLIIFTYIVLSMRYFYQLDFVNTAVMSVNDDFLPLKEIGLEANLPIFKIISAAAILGCVNAQLNIFHDPLTQYYRRKIKEKDESRLLKVRESTIGYYFYCFQVHLKQFVANNISHFLLLYVFASSIIYKSGIGLLFLCILMIILLVEKENRWRTAWIPLSFYALTLLILQYILILKNPETFMRAIITWSGFATEIGPNLVSNILVHVILIFLCIIQRRSEYWHNRLILSNITLENLEREKMRFEESAKQVKEERPDNYLQTRQKQLLQRPIISGSKFIHSYHEIFKSYGYEVAVLMIVIMAFLTINALSVVYIIFASYLVYRSAEKVYSENSKIRKVWKITYILIIMDMIRKYSLQLWFPASWNIPFPWKDSEFLCSEEGKKLFSTRNAFHDESDLVHCINEWKFWLSIEKYPLFFFILEYITVVSLILHEKYLSIPDFIDSSQKDPVSGDENDFTYLSRRTNFMQVLRFYTYNYFYRIPLIVLFIIGALDTLTGGGNFISAIYLLVSMTLLYKSIWFFKNFEWLTERIEIMHSIVLIAFFIFQSPIFPCPVYTEAERSFFPNDECLSIQYESKKFFFGKNGSEKSGYNYFKVSYVLFIQTLGLNKISSSNFSFNSMLMFMILLLFLILIQKKLFRSPNMKAYVIPYQEREKEVQKSKALKFVQSQHLKRIRSHKLTDVKREASAYLQMRVDKKINEWDNLMAKDIEELTHMKSEGEKLSKFDEIMLKKAEQMATKSQRAIISVKEIIDIFEIAENIEHFNALLEMKRAEAEVQELESITAIQAIGIYKHTTIPTYQTMLDDNQLKILEEMRKKAEQDESWRLASSHRSQSQETPGNENATPIPEKEARRKSIMASKAREEQKQNDSLKDFFEEGDSEEKKLPPQIAKEEEMLDDLELKARIQEEEEYVLKELREKRRQEDQERKAKLIKKLERHYNNHTFLLELKETKTFVVRTVKQKILEFLLNRIHEVYFYDAQEYIFSGQESVPVLLWYLFISQFDKFTMLFFVLNHTWNGNILSMIFPLSLFLYAVLENPLPQRIYWKTMIFYTIGIITLKFIYQFPIFCGTPPYSLVSADVLTCQTMNVNPTDLINRIDFIIGIRKFSGNSSYPKNQGFFFGVLMDYITLIMLLCHRHVQKTMGFWKYIKITNSLYYAPQFCGSDVDEIPEDSQGFKNQFTNFFYRLLPNYLPPNHQINNMRTKKTETVQTKASAIKPGNDLYAPQALLSLLILMYYMVYFTKMNGKRETIADTLDKRSHFSSELVYALLFLIAWNIADRVIYRLKDDITEKNHIGRHAMLLKFLLHIFLVVFVHYYLCFKLPFNNKNTFSNSPYLINCYILYSLYFFFSASQIKFGYPELESRQIFMDHISIVNVVAFKGYRAIPFIIDLKNALDWTVARTSLDFGSWVRLDEAYASLFLVKVDMENRKIYPSGVKRLYLEKIFNGYIFVILMIFVIIAPILMFSSLNPILEHNNVQNGSVSLELNYEVSKEGAGKQKFRLKLFEVNNLMISPITNDEFNHLRQMYADIETDWQPRMQIAKIPSYSDNIWTPSPPMLRSLTSILDTEDTELMLEVSWEFHRSKPPGSEIAKGFNHTPLNKKVKNVLKQILEEGSKSPIQSFEAPSLFPVFISLGKSSQAKRKEFQPISAGVFAPESLNAVVEFAEESGKQYWMLRKRIYFPLKNEPIHSLDNKVGIVLLNDFVFGSFFGANTSQISLFGIYATIVLAISKFIRLMYEKSYAKVIYEELPKPDDLIDLCESIFIARSTGDLKKESSLYDLLIRIYRSPEIMLKLTGTKVEYKQEHIMAE